MHINNPWGYAMGFSGVAFVMLKLGRIFYSDKARYLRYYEIFKTQPCAGLRTQKPENQGERGVKF